MSVSGSFSMVSIHREHVITAHVYFCGGTHGVDCDGCFGLLGLASAAGIIELTEYVCGVYTNADNHVCSSSCNIVTCHTQATTQDRAVRAVALHGAAT